MNTSALNWFSLLFHSFIIIAGSSLTFVNIIISNLGPAAGKDRRRRKATFCPPLNIDQCALAPFLAYGDRTAETSL